MKKCIAIAFAASAMVSFAATAENIFGCLRIESDQEQTIIAVPWLSPSQDGADIKVEDSIKTSNLVESDELRYYDTGSKSYKVWTLVNGEWKAANNVSNDATEDGETVDPSLKRGNAILLKRPGITSREDKAIYLYGQVGTAQPGKVLLAAGKLGLPAYSLIAPPAVDETALNDTTKVEWAGVSKSDFIILPSGVMLNYYEGKWAKRVEDLEKLIETYDEKAAVVSAGQGFWFVSQTASKIEEEPSVTWKNAPSGN